MLEITSQPLNDFLASCQPVGTSLCLGAPHQFLPGLGSLLGMLPRKPHQTPRGLNLPGLRMTWEVGCPNYNGCQDSQGSSRTAKINGSFRSVSVCFREEEGGWEYSEGLTFVLFPAFLS